MQTYARQFAINLGYGSTLSLLGEPRWTVFDSDIKRLCGSLRGWTFHAGSGERRMAPFEYTILRGRWIPARGPRMGRINGE